MESSSSILGRVSELYQKGLCCSCWKCCKEFFGAEDESGSEKEGEKESEEDDRR